MKTKDAAPAAPRDAGTWAAEVDRPRMPAEAAAHGYDVDGTRLAGPQQGVGRLWQRSMRTAWHGISLPFRSRPAIRTGR